MPKITEFNYPGLSEAIEHIMGVMAGEDGGGSFVVFMQFLAVLDERCRGGDAEAARLLDMVLHFNRLIEVANKHAT